MFPSSLNSRINKSIDIHFRLVVAKKGMERDNERDYSNELLKMFRIKCQWLFKPVNKLKHLNCNCKRMNSTLCKLDLIKDMKRMP